MRTKSLSPLMVVAWCLAGGLSASLAAPPVDARDRVAVLQVQTSDGGQVPYGFEMPPPRQEAPDTSIPPLNKPLGPEELKRAEALLPLLEGKQEFWAIGEFVHLGRPAVPVVIKALTMPGTRIRYNAIETLLLIKDPSAVPALIQVAKEPKDMPRIREHALRVAVRLDSALTPPAIEVMAKDQESAIRKVAAFEARYVRQKAVVPALIGLMADEERFVAITAIQSLWILTRHESEMHDWDISTKQDREEWAKEWIDWWAANRETFQLPEPRQPRKPLSKD
ncbi:MAG TPA: HEAT repeat domain-containing protein [Nitrospiraceae bacterium]|nr:HEAT repeat domain-containing protein [Nitrospiraceae bacterium]